MKKRSLTLALVFFVALLGMGFSSAEALAQDGPYVQDVGGKGKVDWTQGWIEAVGTGAPPEKYYGKPQARPMALRAAQLDAFRNLLEVVKGVQLTSSTTVEDFVTTSDVIRTQVDGMVKGAQTVKREYLSDGTVEVTVRMALYGNFTQLLLPVEARPAPTPVPPSVIAPPPPVATAPSAAPPAAPPAAPSARIYTGLVVDARGLSARPAMSPKVVDEDGQEVYGTASVSREYAVQQGMAGYSKDVNAAQTNSRVTNSPVTVKGLRTEGAGRSDIVISRADAAALRAAGQDLSFLQKCRVMIVLD